MMALSKWDKISKVDAKELMERISVLDVERSSGRYMEMSMNGMDIYKDQPYASRSYYIVERDEFEPIGTEVIYSKQQMVPTCAEILAQLPKAYKHKIDAFRVDLGSSSYKDIVEDAYRITVDFFKRKKVEVVRTGPLTARDLYMDLIKKAMEPRGEQTGVLSHSSLPDATSSRGQMQKLKELLAEAEHLDDDKIEDAILLFAMNAFKQR
jgi:hypothetical protein